MLRGRWRLRRAMRYCLVPLSLLMYLYGGNALMSLIMESLEDWVKHSALHDAIQAMSRAAPIDSLLMPGATLIHFHVPRTAGDSMRTHLFPVSIGKRWHGGAPGNPWWTPESSEHLGVSKATQPGSPVFPGGKPWPAAGGPYRMDSAASTHWPEAVSDGWRAAGWQLGTAKDAQRACEAWARRGRCERDEWPLDANMKPRMLKWCPGACDQLEGTTATAPSAVSQNVDTVARDWEGSVWPEILTDMRNDNNYTGALNRMTLYAGFLSGADLDELLGLRLKEPGNTASTRTEFPWSYKTNSVIANSGSDNSTTAKLKMFTVLRHPMERAISVAMWWHKQDTTHKNGFNGSGLEAYFLDDTPKQREWHKFSPTSGHTKLHKHRSFLHHSMVYQFGEHIDSRRRKLTPAEALARAKRMLDRFDYIGFYEDMDGTYEGIREHVLGPLMLRSKSQGLRKTLKDSVLGWCRDILFFLGTLTGRSRIKVAKYQAMLSNKWPAELETVRRYTKYDMELWEYALELTGKKSPANDRKLHLVSCRPI